MITNGKKIILGVVACSSLLLADSYNINNGWKLLGALNDINLTKGFSHDCIKTVWGYNSSTKRWKAYSPDTTIKNKIKNNSSTIDDTMNIGKGKGFWVNSNCNLTINSDAEYTYYDKYGYSWLDVKKDDRYTVSGNSVALVNDIFSITAARKDNNESRAEIGSHVPTFNSVSADMNYTTGGHNCSGELRAYANSTSTHISDLNATTFGLDANSTYTMANIKIYGKKIVAQVQLEDNTGKYVEVFKENIAPYDTSSPYIGQEYNATIDLTSSTSIDFKVTKMGTSEAVGTIQTFTIPSDFNATIDSFNTIKLRARVNDDDENKTAGDNASFEVYGVTSATK